MSSIKQQLLDDTGTLTSSLDSDKLIPTSTLEKPYDGYSGRMNIYQSISSTSPFKMDLIVQNVSYAVHEVIQVDENIGNLCSVFPLGMGPMVMTVSGVIPDPGNNYGKDYFMDYYRNYLRIEAVAKRGKMPVYVMPHMAIYASATNLVLTESGSAEDIVFFALTLAVSKIVISDSGTSNVSIDYFHGINIEESYSSDMSDSAKSSAQLNSPSVVVKTT